MENNGKIDKDTLVREISERADFNLGDSRLFVDALIEVFEDAVEKKREFNIRGLGKIVYGKIKARITTDPRSGERVSLPETYRIRFSFSKNILGK